MTFGDVSQLDYTSWENLTCNHGFRSRVQFRGKEGAKAKCGNGFVNCAWNRGGLIGPNRPS